MTENKLKATIEEVKEYIKQKTNNLLVVSDEKIKSYIILCHPEKVDIHEIFLSEMVRSIENNEWNFYDEKTNSYNLTHAGEEYDRANIILKLIKEEPNILLAAASCDGIPLSFCEASPYYELDDNDKISGSALLIEVLRRKHLNFFKIRECINIGCKTSGFIARVDNVLSNQLYAKINCNDDFITNDVLVYKDFFDKSIIKQFVCYDVINDGIYDNKTPLFPKAFSLIEKIDDKVDGENFTIKEVLDKPNINEDILSALSINPNIGIEYKKELFNRGVVMGVSNFPYDKEFYKQFYCSQIDGIFDDMETVDIHNKDEVSHFSETYCETIKMLASFARNNLLPECCLKDFVNRFFACPCVISQDVSDITGSIAGATTSKDVQKLIYKNAVLRDIESFKKDLYFNKNINKEIKNEIGNETFDKYYRGKKVDKELLSNAIRCVEPNNAFFILHPITKEKFYNTFFLNGDNEISPSVTLSGVIPLDILREILDKCNFEDGDNKRTLGEINLILRKNMPDCDFWKDGKLFLLFNDVTYDSDYAGYNGDIVPFSCHCLDITEHELNAVTSFYADYFSHLSYTEEQAKNISKDFFELYKTHKKELSMDYCSEQIFNLIYDFFLYKPTIDKLFDNPVFKLENGENNYEYSTDTVADIQQKKNLNLSECVKSLDTSVLFYICNCIYNSFYFETVFKNENGFLSKAYIDADMLTAVRDELTARGEKFYTKEEFLQKFNKEQNIDNEFEETK